VSNAGLVNDGTTFGTIKYVGRATVGSAIDIFDAATEAARGVLTASAAGVAAVVTHKFGAHAGEVAYDSTGLIVDAYDARRNLQTVGRRAIAKEIGKQTVAQL
jgi:hypothetical protein